jgi:hypothetical protein
LKNRSKRPVFGKSVGQIKNFEIKSSKKLEAISRFLVKTEFKNSKSIDLQNSEKPKPKKKLGK